MGEQGSSDEFDVDMKEFRRKNPSGWMELVRNSSVVYMVDALLDAPPEREFTVSELSNHSGVSGESVRNHISTLVEFGIVNEINGTTPQRYRLDDEDAATQLLFRLNSVLNGKRAEDTPDIFGPEIEVSGIKPDWGKLRDRGERRVSLEETSKEQVKKLINEESY